ncbi:MAG: carboxypeptidase regulatory-like domain-containing protein [Verrucomicrobia bacterium]|nr:carboxypeptidase regulatory-like domain-containing protein [Verrucomicrobiota bacterium]
MTIKSLHICFLVLLVSAIAGWASPTGPARIQGVVKDSKGQAVAGAEVHITAKDGSGLQKIIRTDGSGNYGCSNLPVTDYEVVLFVGGQIKASLTNQHVFGNKPTKLDFKLTGAYAANARKKHTHMVYMPAETGSNLSGHWVEVDDASGAGAAQESGDVKKLSGAAVRQMQTGGFTGGGN